MDYIITNKKLYIKLGEKGIPVTCSKQEAQRFEDSKARNILDNLPKTMKRFNFKCQAVHEEETGINRNIRKEIDKEIIEKNVDYKVTENITQWKEKFGVCSDILKEAQERQKILCKELDNYHCTQADND